MESIVEAKASSILQFLHGRRANCMSPGKRALWPYRQLLTHELTVSSCDATPIRGEWDANSRHDQQVAYRPFLTKMGKEFMRCRVAESAGLRPAALTLVRKRCGVVKRWKPLLASELRRQHTKPLQQWSAAQGKGAIVSAYQ